jgi:hypothetical protein
MDASAIGPERQYLDCPRQKIIFPLVRICSADASGATTPCLGVRAYELDFTVSSN